MTANAANDESLGETPKREEPENRSSVLNDVQSLWHELRGLAHDHFLLAALETRRVAVSFITMIVTSLLAVIFLNSAWLGLVAAAVVRMIENGMPASTAILLAVAGNLLIVLVLCLVIRRKSRYLQFPAILDSLKPKPLKQHNKER